MLARPPYSLPATPRPSLRTILFPMLPAAFLYPPAARTPPPMPATDALLVYTLPTTPRLAMDDQVRCSRTLYMPPGTSRESQHI
ncbi:hypothetical protein VTO73DRAFT_751 [Trametes versicolor]